MRKKLRGRRRASAATVLALALAVPLGAQAIAAPTASAPSLTPASADNDGEIPRQYEVAGITTAKERTKLARTGVAIDGATDELVVITADKAEAAELRASGYTLTARPGPEERDVKAAAPSDYHTYEEMMTAVDGYVEQYPELVSKEVIGTSHEGRDIIAVKLSADVAEDRDTPEVLFTHNQHAREHLTVEMALFTLEEFTSGYGTDDRVTKVLDEREVWVIPSVNPDGKVYDQESGQFRMWRKNRQPNEGTNAVGTDLNRNWSYEWGCCGGSSSNPASETYRGPSAASAPETQVVQEFVRSRVVGGEQQIKAHIDFHTYGELVLWPYGYTYDDTAPGMTQDDHDVFETVGTQMADSNGYTPQQASDLYLTDGAVDDWMWGDQKIFSYTFEMYPTSGSPDGFYPPGSVIEEETARNKEAQLILLENADCMYRSIGKEGEYCEA